MTAAEHEAVAQQLGEARVQLAEAAEQLAAARAQLDTRGREWEAAAGAQRQEAEHRLAEAGVAAAKELQASIVSIVGLAGTCEGRGKRGGMPAASMHGQSMV